MLTSMMFAPPSTCCRAMETASARLPSRTSRANFREPETLVRSPIIVKVLSGRMHVRLQAAVTRWLRLESRHLRLAVPVPCSRGGLPATACGDRADVRGRGAAASAHDVQPAVGGELAEHCGHLLRRFVVAAEFVGQAGVGMATRPHRAEIATVPRRTAASAPGPSAQLMPTLNRSAWAMEIKKASSVWPGKRPPAAVGDRHRGHHRQADVVLFEIFFDGEQAGLQVERVEDGFGQEDIDAGFDQRRRPARSRPPRVDRT